MAITSAPEIRPQDLVPQGFTEESIMNIKGIAGVAKPLAEQFGRFISPGGEQPKEISFELEPQGAQLDGAAMAFTPEQTSLISEQLVPEQLVPVQKEALAIKPQKAPTDIENAESIVHEEVSMDVLTLAMNVQEKAQQEQVLPTNVSKEVQGKTEFPALKEVVSAPLVQEGSVQNVPLIQGNSAAETAMPKETMPDANADLSAARTAPLAKKQEPASPAQSPKAKEGALSTEASLKDVGRDAIKALENAQGGRNDDADLDFEQSMDEKLTKENKGDAKLSAPGKTFSDNMTASLKGESPSVATTSEPLTQSSDGKAVEAAFNRAQENGSAQGPKATTTSQPQSQAASLPPQSSVQEQVAFTIKNNVAKGKSEMSLQLRPDNLGRVNIKIDVNKEGQSLVIVATERQETRDMLQQDARQLMDLLKESDIDVSESDISYNLFQDQKEKEDSRGDEGQLGQPSSEGGKNDPQKVSGSLSSLGIPLGMEEVRVPRHGGTWETFS